MTGKLDYLLEYVNHRQSTDAPDFKKQILRSFYKKTFLLFLFLPIDFIYIILNYGKLRKKFNVIVFSEKYKHICDDLRGNIGLISHPSYRLFIRKQSNTVYIPASLYFLCTFISLKMKKVTDVQFLKLKTRVLVLHTDALMVPRYLLKTVIFKKSICIQHGEFKYLNDVYDGKICTDNIVLGQDQATLFVEKKYSGNIFAFERSYARTKHSQINAIVLVGQGYHVNSRVKHRKYQKTLKSLYKDLKPLGFQIYYRPHPSESFWNYFCFWGKTEKKIRRDEFTHSSLYVGQESTLLRQVRENGGSSCLLKDIDADNLLRLTQIDNQQKIVKKRTKLNRKFEMFATKTINEIA